MDESSSKGICIVIFLKKIEICVSVLSVIDVYQAWCGPCKAVINLFRKLKNEYGEDNLLHFAVVRIWIIN